jgi:hypothetical protein
MVFELMDNELVEVFNSPQKNCRFERLNKQGTLLLQPFKVKYNSAGLMPLQGYSLSSSTVKCRMMGASQLIFNPFFMVSLRS